MSCSFGANRAKNYEPFLSFRIPVTVNAHGLGAPGIKPESFELKASRTKSKRITVIFCFRLLIGRAIRLWMEPDDCLAVPYE